MTDDPPPFKERRAKLLKTIRASKRREAERRDGKGPIGRATASPPACAVARRQDRADRPPESMTTRKTKPDSPCWCPNAPTELIEFHGKTSFGGDVLGRLLRDPKMDRAWGQIERQRQISQNGSRLAFTYVGLRGMILTAYSHANRAEKRRKARHPSLHAESRQHALEAAKMASRLAEHLSRDGPLDFLAHTLFPEDVERLALMGIPDRNLNKAGVALANATFVELLREFQRRALVSAQRPAIVQRVGADVRLVTFCRELVPFFDHRFGRPMYSVVAAIATVALEIPAHQQVTGEDARKMIPPKNRQ